MRHAGRIVAAAIELLKLEIRPGMKTRELDALAEREIRRLEGLPSFKGYRGFPATICISVNEELVHGIPGDRVIQEGDLVSMDVGAIYQGFHGDAAVTVGVGKIGAKAQELIEITRQALNQGIQAATEGARIGDISHAVQSFVEPHGLSVVREYVGHGIGRRLHEDPPVPNFGPPGRGPLLQKGMAIAIEPMVNLGDSRTRMLEDNWTVVTIDGKLCAHFEHTIAITEGSAEVLTTL